MMAQRGNKSNSLPCLSSCDDGGSPDSLQVTSHGSVPLKVCLRLGTDTAAQSRENPDDDDDDDDDDSHTIMNTIY